MRIILTFALVAFVAVSPAVAGPKAFFKKIAEAPVNVSKHAAKGTYHAVCKVGAWNDKTHFGSGLGLVANVYMLLRFI